MRVQGPRRAANFVAVLLGALSMLCPNDAAQMRAQSGGGGGQGAASGGAAGVQGRQERASNATAALAPIDGGSDLRRRSASTSAVVASEFAVASLRPRRRLTTTTYVSDESGLSAAIASIGVPGERRKKLELSLRLHGVLHACM